MTSEKERKQTAFVAQARQRPASRSQQQQQPAVDTARQLPADSTGSGLLESQQQSPESDYSRVGSMVKLAAFGWFSWWFVHYFEIDRSLRQEPGTPQISLGWLYAAACSLLPFVFVYLYASVWRRRILGEPLDLQNWQASSSSLVHAATIGLLFAWVFAVIALFPGYGLKSAVIVVVSTICLVAITDAIEGIF
ncbi:hypothetical protein H4R22_000479 [Coemansia sp. RSA 1290]|nr:hypothetical protein LPJ79_002483 [Coemansia sp. RSA 1821]KAJ1872886.1 hypothetical protein LPJ55_002781 [Coemansia sp. RSA 990]KAJ2633481.1 hypothetical protein H4R22_000479 [Coemansia sp. RSA 1290]KAJ2646531.1 hypothetical protein IWW40_005333 [Coemansia sp. RSA 1250]